MRLRTELEAALGAPNAERTAQRHQVTKEKLEQYWPGGEENPYPGRGGWVYCFAMYLQFWGLVCHFEDDPETAEQETAAIDAAIARRSAAQPELVTLTNGNVVAVQPKGFHALSFLDFLEAQHRHVAAAAASALAAEDAESLKVVALYPLAQSLAVRVWAWILTSEGAGLPFPDDGTQLEPPAFTESLTAIDLIALYQAHVRVNLEDSATIARAFPSDPRESRLALAGFLNTYAGEAKQRPFDVFRRFSLGEVFANAVSSAQASREAMEHAKKQQQQRER